MSVLLRFENGYTKDLIKGQQMAKQKQAVDISNIFDSQRAYKLIQMIAEIEDSNGFQ